MIPGLAPDFERILEAGNQAPSGENCQPWRFVVRTNVIEVHLLPERDQSAYGWGQRASYLANGAAIENIVTAASKEGHRADVTYFPDSSDPNHVVNISIVKNAITTPDPLAEFIFKRASNRKSYAKEPLSEEIRQKLLAAGALLAEKPEDIVRLGRVGSTNEEVMLGNKGLHNFFFSHVTWTYEEDQKKKIGFYIKTLELPPPAQAMFKLIRHWGVMQVFKMIGFPKVIAKQNGTSNAAASAMTAFPTEGTEPVDFVKVGRAVERFWLTATSLGLSLQPMTGVLFFKLLITAGKDSFTPSEKKIILDAYQQASDIFHTEGKHIAFMCRIGKGEPPSAQAIRFPLVDVVTVRS